MTERSSYSGLGKGLSGILGDVMAAERAPAVAELLGASAVRRDPEVRRQVTGLALDALVEDFDADAAVLVSRDGDNELASVSSRLPSGWDVLEAVPFEIVGRLWRALNPDAKDREQVTLSNRTSLLISRFLINGLPTAVAVVRSRPFSQREETIIGRLIHSVASALHGEQSLPLDAVIRVLTSDSADGVLADVRIGDDVDRRHAAAVAADGVEAVARAAAELCDASLAVVFAGQSRVQKSMVTIVVLEDGDDGPLFGLAVSDPAASSGPVEAVFSAARVAHLDPFAASLSRT